MNRREFIHHSGVLTLMGAAFPLDAFSDAPPVRVAVVGTGGRGTDLIRKLSAIERAEIVAICDNYPPHLEKAHEVAGPQAHTFQNYSNMLEKVQPEAIVIATPLYLHYDMCVEAIEAGCAVFCEKTMCYSLEQAKKLKTLVQEKAIIFQVGLQRRANPIYRQAAAMVETGMLGQITAIKCQWHRNNDWRRPVPVKKGEKNWKTLEHRLNWRLYEAYSRGLMTELASHQLDVANWMLGTPPTRVMGSGGIDYWRDGREVFDNIFCVYEYELKPQNKEPYTVRVTYSSLQNNAYEGASELIMGTEGTLFLSTGKGLFYREKGKDEVGWDPDGRVDRDAAVITSGKTLKLSNDPWAHRGKPYEIDAATQDTRDELIAFLDCVQRKDVNTICDVQVGLEDTATVLAGFEAMKQGRKIEIDRL